jgi:hypothetical protein
MGHNEETFTVTPESSSAAGAEKCAPIETTDRLIPESTPAAAGWWGIGWLSVISLALLGGIMVAVAVWFYVPVKYTARAIIQISYRAPEIIGQGRADEDFTVFQRTTAALVKSPLVLNNALNDNKVQRLSILQKEKDPQEWLESALQFDFTLSPELMRVSLSGDQPDELVILLNAIIEAFNKEVVGDETNQRRERVTKMRLISAQYDERVRRLRTAFMPDAAGSGNHTNVQFKQQLRQQVLSDYTRELTRVQLALTAARARLAAPYAKATGQKSNAQDSEELRRLQESVATYEIQEKSLEAAILQMDEEGRELVKSSVDLEGNKEVLDNAEKFAGKLRELTEAFQVNLDSGSRISIWDRADVRLASAEWHQFVIAGGAGLGAFVLILAAFGCRRFYERRRAM